LRTLLWAACSLTALAVVALGVPSAAAQGAAKPDLAKAKQTAEQICAACHGADGNSAIAANPNLAGQGAEYISRQLQHFKAGIRVNAVMQGMVATLAPEDMVALGIYFSQQKPKNPGAKDPGTGGVGAAALSRRRCGVRAAGVRGLSFADRRGHPQEFSAIVGPVRRLHVRAIAGVQDR
jgi:cytochrome c553